VLYLPGFILNDFRDFGNNPDSLIFYKKKRRVFSPFLKNYTLSFRLATQVTYSTAGNKSG